MKNLLQNIPADLPEERFETLVGSGNVTIERILSLGHSSPKEGWYDQDRQEFVLLVEGAAQLEFEDGRLVRMVPGDWLEIQVHERHRVAWTDPERPTVWLAVHY